MQAALARGSRGVKADGAGAGAAGKQRERRGSSVGGGELACTTRCQRNQRDDQPCLIYLRVISLVARPPRKTNCAPGSAITASECATEPSWPGHSPPFAAGGEMNFLKGHRPPSPSAATSPGIAVKQHRPGGVADGDAGRCCLMAMLLDGDRPVAAATAALVKCVRLGSSQNSDHTSCAI